MSRSAAEFEEQVQPLKDKVWVRADRRALKRKSGIVIPTWDSRDRDWPWMTGWIVAKDYDIEDVELGDMVIVEIHSGVPYRIGEEVYLCVHRDDILAIIGEQEGVC